MDIIKASEVEYKLLLKKIQHMCSGVAIPTHLKGKPEDIVTIMQMGYEMGLGFMESLNGIDVIQGRVSIKPRTLTSQIFKRYPTADIDYPETGDPLKVVCRMKRPGKANWNFISTWDMEKAAKMGLTTRDNWKKQPETMLRWRATAEAARFVFPEVTSSMYTADETEDMGEPPVRDIDVDFPIPEEEKVHGPGYRFQNGKFRGKLMSDVDPVELGAYTDYLELEIEKGRTRNWTMDTKKAIETYLTELDTNTIEVQSE